MVVLPGQRTVEPLPAVATGMVHPPNQMAAAMARMNRKIGRRPMEPRATWSISQIGGVGLLVNAFRSICTHLERICP